MTDDRPAARLRRLWARVGWVLAAAGAMVLSAWLGQALAPSDGRGGEGEKEGNRPPSSEGRALFRTGASPGGLTLRAALGTERVAVEGMAAACANCHGLDGRGGLEGGYDVPPITADRLFAPRTGLRERPAYTRESLSRAVREGVSATGRPLSPVMPRYPDAGPALEEVLRFVERLGTLPPEGVHPARLRVAAEGEPARALSSLFDAVNAQGGVWGRRLEIVAPGEGQPPALVRVVVVVVDDEAAAAPDGDPLRQGAVLAGAVLVEALQRAGADVDAQAVHEALERGRWRDRWRLLRDARGLLELVVTVPPVTHAQAGP